MEIKKKSEIKKHSAEGKCNEEIGLQNTSYVRTAYLDNLFRGAGYEVLLVSEECLTITKICTDGCRLTLKLEVNEFSVNFQLFMPMDFKSVNQQILETLNDFNNWSRSNGHAEFWSVDEEGHVCLGAMIVDNGNLDEMYQYLNYIVKDHFEFAEQGWSVIKNILEGTYAPSVDDVPNIYR